MTDDTDWATPYGRDSGDDPGGRSGPPVWVVVVVVVSVVVGGWLLATEAFSGGDSAAVETTIPFEPFATTTTTAPVTTTTTVSVATTLSVAPVDVSDFGNPPISLTADTPEQLRGYVAVTSPDEPPFNQHTVWVFRPGGSLVSRADTVIERVSDDYPMLITAGRLILGNRIFDIDLAEPPISLWVDGSVIPGSGPGDVWLEQTQDGFIDNVDPEGEDAYRLWVSPVDVESLTVGEQVEVTRVFDRPVVGVADGLIVDGRWMWTPADGSVSLDLPGSATVVSASGDFVVTDAPGQADIIDIVSGEHVASVLHDLALPGVRSACLSPDRDHVILVAWNGEAVVGNTETGEVTDLNEVAEHFENLTKSIQQDHGIGWTANDQLVFIAEGEGARNVFGYNIATDESFHVATLESPAPWWLAASGTMC